MAAPSAPSAPSATDPMTQEQLAAVIAGTLGYYGLRDAVSTPWLRRTGQAVVLAGAAAPITVTEFRSSNPEETRKEISDNLAEAVGNWREQSAATKASTAVVLVGGVAGAVSLAGWVMEKIDGVGESAVRKVGGRLPVVGGLCRRIPNTVNGALQCAVAVGVNTVLTSRQAGRAGNGKA